MAQVAVPRCRLGLLLPMRHLFLMNFAAFFISTGKFPDSGWFLCSQNMTDASAEGALPYRPSEMETRKTFQVRPGFIFLSSSRFGIEARAHTKGLRHFTQTPFVAEVPRSSSPRHGPNLTGSVPKAGEPNLIMVENRSDQYVQNTKFRTLARESSSDETIPGLSRWSAPDRVIGSNSAYALMRKPS
jgi:hypothetical protein